MPTEWLTNVIQGGGENCRNCGQWRILRDREIKECPQCGDEAFDIYDVVMQDDGG